LGHTFAHVATTGPTCPNGATEVEKRHHARLVAHVGWNEVRSPFPAVRTATWLCGALHCHRVRIPRGPISGCAPQLLTQRKPLRRPRRQKRKAGLASVPESRRRGASLEWVVCKAELRLLQQSDVKAVDFATDRERLCVCCVMKTKNAPLPYESLCTIGRGFEQILKEFEHLEELDWFRQHAPMKSVRLAVREVRAWTLSEILDVLQQREEGEWMRLGRLRIARERRLEKRFDSRKQRTQRKRGRTPKS